MSKVKVGGNWAYIDELDGEVLRDNEWVVVTWPDATVENFAVHIDQSHIEVQDMSTKVRVPVRKAYVITDVHGQKVKVRLKKFDDVKRVVEEGA